MTAHDDAAAQAPAPAVPRVPTVRDVLASCAAARTVSTAPCDPAARSEDEPADGPAPSA